MFKRLCVLLLTFLLLCGCAQQNAVTPVLDNISFTAKIDYGDTEFFANATLGEDALNLILTDPKEINGLTLRLDNNGLMVEFNGVTYTPDINELPYGATVKVLYEVLNDISASQSKAVCNEENCEIKGEVNGYKYKFIFSPSGLPISLSIDDLDFKIEFKNVTVN